MENITTLLDVAEFMEFMKQKANNSTIPAQTSQQLAQTPSQPQISCTSLPQTSSTSQPLILPISELQQPSTSQPQISSTLQPQTTTTSLPNQTTPTNYYSALDAFIEKQLVTPQILHPSPTSLPLPTAPKVIVSFTDQENKFLLERYNEYMDEIGPKKKFRIKKAMWAQIAEEMRATIGVTKTSEQLENRYKTIMRKRKAVIDHNRKSGNNRMEMEFEEECDAIVARDDSIEPEIVRGVGYVRRKGQNATVTTTSKTNYIATTSTATSTDTSTATSTATTSNASTSNDSTSNATANLNNVKASNIRWAKKKTPTQVMRETLLQIEARREARSAAIEERREQRHQEKMALLRQILEAQQKNG